MPLAKRRKLPTADAPIPMSMVRISAYRPSPPFSAPPGQVAIGLSLDDPVMPVGATAMQIISGAGAGPGELLPISGVALLDPYLIAVYFPDTYTAKGVYIPYNDLGFRGINGGMLNPGELTIRATGPAPFPWVCAIG